MEDHAPAFDMPNNMKPENYPQHFVRCPYPNKPGPTNEAAKKVPTLEQAIKGIYRK